ncbi:MAG: lipocalin family protein [Muribaculaceae bacterium]|nr:lipocalin family protein [Muribaculaceae bacterium]
MTVFSKFANVVNAKWLLAMFVVLAAVSSCGFDDDETQPDTYPLELLGTWEGTDAEITVTDAEGVECGVRTESLENIRVVINPNGTFVTYECDETEKWREKDRSFWQYKDGTLFVFDGGETIQNYNVTKVTSDYLVLKSVVDVPEPGDADAGDEAGDVAEELPAGGTVTTVCCFPGLWPSVSRLAGIKLPGGGGPYCKAHRRRSVACLWWSSVSGPWRYGWSRGVCRQGIAQGGERALALMLHGAGEFGVAVGCHPSECARGNEMLELAFHGECLSG